MNIIPCWFAVHANVIFHFNCHIHIKFMFMFSCSQVWECSWILYTKTWWATWIAWHRCACFDDATCECVSARVCLASPRHVWMCVCVCLFLYLTERGDNQQSLSLPHQHFSGDHYFPTFQSRTTIEILIFAFFSFVNILFDLYFSILDFLCVYFCIYIYISVSQRAEN